MNLRIKTGSLPGDVGKHLKEAMLEGKPLRLLERGMYPLKGKPAKAFKKAVRMKERAVLKRRAQKRISEEK